MRNATGKLKLLLIAFAVTAAQRGYLAGTDDRGFAQEGAGKELAATEAETVLTDPLFMPCETQCLPAPFAASYPSIAPTWYCQVEGLTLKRDASGDQTFQAFVERVWERQENPYYHATSSTDPTPIDPTEPEWVWETTGDLVTPVLGTEHLHFGFQAGGRALVGRTLGQCHAFEVSYFEVTDWDEIASVRDATVFVQDKDRVTGVETTFPASLFSPFSDFGDPPIEGLDYNNFAQISYSSDLYNIEWNLRRWILADPRRLQASVLVGGRYMDIGESFYYHTESAVPGPGVATNAVTTETDNSMIGVQIGAMFEFYVDPGWWVDCEIKGAVFNNDASQSTTYVHDGVPDYQGTHVGRREDDITAFALDLRLTATVLVTQRLAVIGGYQALWVDGLALASENMSRDVDVLVSGPASLVEDGKVLYHGPHLGITWVW